MSDDTGDPDPIELLRRANPVATDRLPPGSEARLRARVLEDTMAGNQTTVRRGALRGSMWPILSGAGAVALALAVVVGSGLVKPGGGAPITSLAPTDGPVPTASATGGPIGGGGMAMCAFMYDLDTLADREWAFDGVLTAIDGNQGTFRVNRWFKGGEGDSVTRTVDGMTAESGLLGGPGLVVDGRYLVTGDDVFAWSCGFTQYWNEAVAADWARVLGG